MARLHKRAISSVAHPTLIGEVKETVPAREQAVSTAVSFVAMADFLAYSS